MTAPLRRVYAGREGRWDARRNTSMVHAVPRGEGLRVAAMLGARSQEDWYRWIADGRPALTEAEYERQRPKR